MQVKFLNYFDLLFREIEMLKYPILSISKIFVFLMIPFLFTECSDLSESYHDKTAGMNGSFEVVKAGLPVNWNVNTPNTVQDGNFQVIVDSLNAKDGKRSLEFDVKECSTEGGYLSPGFNNEFKVESGQEYKISFWVKNRGSEFIVRVGGVTTFTGTYSTVIRSQDTIPSWQQVVYNYTVPSRYKKIRFDLNILQPGTFWIDDIRIEKL